MNTWPSIHREGALALSPNDVAKGNKELNALIDSSARSIAKREMLFAGFHGLAVATILIAGIACLVFMSRKPSTFASNVSLAILLLGAVMIPLLWWAWAAIQNGRIVKRLGTLSDVTIPEPLQELIYSFASGVREARTASGNTVRPSMFASQWAIMLFSHEENHRLWVRSRRGSKQREEIFVLPEQSEAMQQPSGTVPAAAGAIQSESIQSIANPVTSGTVEPGPSESVQPIPEPATPDTIAQVQSEIAQRQERATSAVAMEHSSTIPSTTAPVRSDSSTTTRDEKFKLVAASLDEAKISKRDVKSHHIAERWNKNDGPQPDVGSVRALMKGQQAGAPARSKDRCSFQSKLN